MADDLLHHLRRAADRFGDDLPMRVRPTLAGSRTGPDSRTRPEAPETVERKRAVEPMPPTAPAAPRPREQAPLEALTLDALAAEVAGCSRCKLHEGRNNLVFGEGSPTADLMFVGEAPGAREDQLGRPFVGPAGQLLTKIIENAVGMPRGEVYIANVNKCRPPGNRNPEPDEVAACLPILRQQIALVAPRVIVALGRVAAANLLASSESVTRLRGRHDLEAAGVPVVVTWHPAYLLRNPAAKGETWEDIKRVNRLLGRPEVPGAGG